MSVATPEIYLAARFSRRDELRGYAAELEAIGFKVPARWLREEHDLPIDAKPNDPRGALFAQDDFDDLKRAELVVCFTEPPGEKTGRGRGGRHVELGLALAWQKQIAVVGHRENVFCWLPQVAFFPEWSGLYGELRYGTGCACGWLICTDPAHKHEDSLESLGVDVL